jgi:PAS domain S-box-containing protein
LTASFITGNTLPEYNIYSTEADKRHLTFVNAITQDSLGFIWMASQHGLHRFDGQRFHSYYSDSLSSTLLVPHFLAVHYDHKHRIWLGTYKSGFHLFDPLYETFTPFLIPSENPKDNSISYFSSVPGDSFLYILTGNHKIFRFHLEKLRLDESDALDFINSNDDFSSVYSIYVSDEKTIWLGADENKLLRCDLASKTSVSYTIPKEQQHPYGRIRNITPNRFGRLLITYTRQALFDFNPKTGFFNLVFPMKEKKDSVSEIFYRSFEDQYGNYWLSASKDIYHIDPTNYNFRVYNVLPPDADPKETNRRYPIFEDKQGIILTATGKGVYRFIRKSPVYYHLDTEDSKIQKDARDYLLTLTTDFKNQVWVGARSGFYRVDKMARELISIPLPESWTSPTMNKILEHPEGSLWLGGQHNLGKMNLNTGEILTIKDTVGISNILLLNDNELVLETRFGPALRINTEPPYTSKTIPLIDNRGDTLLDYQCKNIFMDKNRRLWTARNGKLFFTDTSQSFFQYHSINDSVPGIQYALPRFLHDSRGYLWITNHKSGLIRIDPDQKSFRHFKHHPTNPTGIPSNGITTIAEDKEGRIWMGTFLTGLVYYDYEQDRFYTYMQNSGLSGNGVYNIFFDRNNNLWISTNLGLSHMHRKSGNFVNFPYEEGFSFNMSNSKAIEEYQDLLYLGNKNGLFIISPYLQEIPKNKSRTLITGLKVNNNYLSLGQADEEGRVLLTEPLLISNHLTFTPKDLMVNFEFIHLDFIAPEKNQYAYMLEGLEKDYHYVGTQSNATYTFLPPGNFTLKIKAANAYGVWTDNTTDIRITVIPPFYKKFWFQLLVAAAILGIIVLVYQIRTFSIRRHNEALQTINKQLEDEIIERELVEAERLRLISAIEQSIDAVMITNTEGEIRYVNPAFGKMTGYNPDDVIGQHIRLLKSGKQSESFYQQMWKKIGGGAVWSGKLINMRADGTLITVEESITPVRDDSGEIINYVAIMRNITDQEKIEKELQQAQKMQAIGTLAGGIAHDFNNILSSISLNADIILSSTYAQTDIQEDANEILVAAHRGKELVEQILTFSRQGENKAEMVQVDNILQSVNRMLKATIPSTIHIDTITEPCPTIYGSATHLYQIILNLATNARDAIEGTGKISIVMKPLSLRENTSGPYKDLRPDNYLYISVSDTGKGMSPELVSRIFDPFFTTKEVGRGTGMGLAIVHGIVQKYNGRILVHSKEDEGTTFEVFLSQDGLQKQ